MKYLIGFFSFKKGVCKLKQSILSYLNSNINPCTKVRKLLCLFKEDSGVSAMFPNTYICFFWFVVKNVITIKQHNN